VAEVLDGDHVHLTADEVHARAVQRLPEISRATVYNALGELVALGEVIEVSTDGRAKRYDPNAHRPHQHLVCSGCGIIRDVHPTGDPLSGLPAQERFGFEVSKVEVTYRGLCPSCA
jgi:Fur family ferric uptake transcriptional regulator